MAKNAKKISPLGILPEDFKETRLPTHTPTHTHTHNDTHSEVYEPKQKEIKSRRIQILTYDKLINRMDAYAAKRGVNRVAVFEAAITDYLDRVDPQE